MGVRWMARSSGAVVAVVVVWLVFAGGAWGASVSLCVSSTAGQPVTSGACSSGGTTVRLPASAADQNTLLSVLPHMSFISSGVGGKPMIRFSQVNVQIVSGSGSTSGAVNGAGNLIVGYAENASSLSRTGSHDLVVGVNNGWKSYGEIVGGNQNQALGAYATVFGRSNKASGSASLAAGEANTASGGSSSVSGGVHNTASGSYTSVTGGCSNIAGAGTASASSGCTNTTSNPNSFASVTGGVGNQASGTGTGIGGGEFNVATDPFSNIDGGCDNLAGTGTKPDGNCALSGAESILGGDANSATGGRATVIGGYNNLASGFFSTVFGQFNTASGNTA